MVKKKELRLGSDPLKWIQDSRDEDKASKSDKASKQDKLSRQDKSKRQSVYDKQELQESEDKLSMVSKEELQRKKSGASPQEEQEGEWMWATFILRVKYLEKIKAVAYWDRKQIKEVLDEALEEYLASKKVEPIPHRKR